jgi:protein tyrosine phosphatase (PTP) superfamily phosphohydrolase (DUF442 family)
MSVVANTRRTLKTLFGYLATLVRKYTPMKRSNNSLEGIFNYHLVNGSIATSGQPSEQQFSVIREAGYQSIINLAPHSAENSLPDEAGLLHRLGMQYVHIPVDFKNPTDDDFQAFVAALQNSPAGKTWVHCAANMRVSAFVYKYRRDVLHEDPVIAKVDLEKIWEPFGVWKNFLSKT